MKPVLKFGVFFAVLAILASAVAFASDAPLSSSPQHESFHESSHESSHGQSLFGALKYPPDFPHFDYVNPNAPKGGTLKLAALGGFDSLNPFLIKGRAAASLGLIYDTLTRQSLDEPASEYGLVAEKIVHEPQAVVFHLRKTARFHDGQPITPEDVIFSLETLKKAHPFFRAYYADIVRAEKISPHAVRLHFRTKGNRELPHIAGQLPVLPAHYWQKEGRDFFAASLASLPLGSGPYKIAKFEAGKHIEYQRVDSYWGKNLPVSKGMYNFDTIRLDYYGDDSVALEAFKAGDYDFRAENTAKNWATAYEEVKQRKSEDLILRRAESGQGRGMQAYVFNLRRNKFKDARVREAFDLAFDFSWINQHLFYGQYQRTQSFFAASDLAATGLPQGEEKTLLETMRQQFPQHVPPQSLTQVKQFPQHGDRRAARQHLAKAGKLLDAAGWRVVNGVRQNQAGESLAVEFLLVSPAFERIVLHYVGNLKKLGIVPAVRVVDAAQYKNRLNQYDFDIIIHTFSQSLSPGNEQRDFWASSSADIAGGRNLAGIKNPAVDALVEILIEAENRQNLIAATKALDRVLLWNHYVVPQWHIAYHRLAWWKPLAAPAPLPLYGIGMPAIWWQEQAP